MLEHLERANLFMVPLDDDRRWYRYHHLLTEALRQRLRREEPHLVSGLHRRAAEWYERQGVGAEAVRHALAAGDWERAVRVVVRTLPSFVFRGQFRTGLSWLDALPDAFVRADLTLCVYHAGMLMYSNRLGEAEARLRDTERGLREAVSEYHARTIRGQVATIRGAIARISGDLARCVALSRKALDLLPEPEVVPLKLRSAALLNASRAFLVSGNVTPAGESSVASVVAPVWASGNRHAALGSVTNLARLRVLQGRLR